MDDRELIYMAGNGLMVAAYHDGDMVNLFGPPYSSPSLFDSKLMLADDVRKTKPYHLDKAGIWRINLEREGKKISEITDFALADEPCIVRHVETREPIKLMLGVHQNHTDLFSYEISADETNPNQGYILKTKGGNYVYNEYPLPFPQFYRLLVRGDGAMKKSAPFQYEISITGTADILIIGGPSFPECDMAFDRIYPLPYELMLSLTENSWHDEFAQISEHISVPGNMPERERVIKAIEDTYINIAVQQSAQGGVMAGIPFPLGYVRDQFGVCMCMLRLGLYQRARRMLEFYLNTFRTSGQVLNAQGLGVPGLFHFAENDATEITGYLLLQFFRYADVTGDWELLRENADFLLWLYKRQESQIHNNMLPFNGDETYIAGGLLPRDVINEGSAEATMLFILSGRRLAEFLRDEELNLININVMELILKAVETDYRRNFVKDNKYTINNPDRLQGLSEPRYRYGVCMNLGKDDCEFFGWTTRSAEGVYVCSKCLSRGAVPRKITRKFYIPSALLMPAYLDSPLPGDDVVLETLNTFAREGFGSRIIGYDYGLLLINYIKYDLPGKEQLLKRVLDLADGVGTWAERYVDGVPDGCRFRPWESAINLDAILQLMYSYRK